MALHGLTRITLGVPDVGETGAYYEAFGLASLGEGRYATTDGGHQLTLVQSQPRQLLEVRIGVDAPEDLQRVAANLEQLGVPARLTQAGLLTAEPVAKFAIVLEVSARLVQHPVARTLLNRPGLPERPNERTAAFYRTGPVRPRRLGHVVIGCADLEASRNFFLAGLGFKPTDTTIVNGTQKIGTFMRCSSDHHNVFLLRSDRNFLHHTGWEVEDVDEVGRGATHMIKRDQQTHTWGLGRHFVGSNFFWYLKDPAGNFVEYYSDMDHIHEDFGWVEGQLNTGLGWGLSPPASFINPSDLLGFEG